MTRHDYLSTACLHENHEACRLKCKFCVTHCRCDCHLDIRWRGSNCVCGARGIDPDAHKCIPGLAWKVSGLEEKLRWLRDEQAALKHTIVATIGGTDYEGNPTSEINYLQRLRILLEKEKELDRLRAGEIGKVPIDRH